MHVDWLLLRIAVINRKALKIGFAELTEHEQYEFRLFNMMRASTPIG